MIIEIHVVVSSTYMLFACIHLNIVELLLYVRYCARQDRKCSSELERVLCLFVIYNQHLPGLRRGELTLERAPQHLSWTLKARLDFSRWGGEEGTFLATIRGGKWQGVFMNDHLVGHIVEAEWWNEPSGAAAGDKEPDHSRLALNAGVASLSSVFIYWCTICIFWGKV